MPRRAYSDVESEMANQLSILPNFQAWCRLIDVPDAKGELPRLVERKIVTEELGGKRMESSQRQLYSETIQRDGTFQSGG